MPLKPPVSGKDHIEGRPDALIEIVEYGDYQCPHCAKAYGIVKKLQETFGDRLKFVFRNFPLTKIHPEAKLAAVAAEAAALQGKFTAMHDIIFMNQDNLLREDLIAYAKELGLDIRQFQKDLERNELIEKVEADFESGVRSGVNATPTFFINGEKYNLGWEGERITDFIRKQGL